jgi:hypothetical protein
LTRPNAERDWAVWDETSSPASNADIVNLKRSIDATVERRDLVGLEGMRDSDVRSVTFKGAKDSDRASIYYHRAGQYPRAHITQPRAALAAKL